MGSKDPSTFLVFKDGTARGRGRLSRQKVFTKEEIEAHTCPRRARIGTPICLKWGGEVLEALLGEEGVRPLPW